MKGAFGERWKIDGVTAGPITRGGVNGQYTIIFERCYTSLEEIETINWSKPTLEYIWPYGSEAGLPEGYGFSVEGIDYNSGGKYYRVTVKTEFQYLGDVTGYQEQIAALEATVSDQKTQLSEKDATIQTMKEAGTAADLEAELDAAYEEGVNSVE